MGEATATENVPQKANEALSASFMGWLALEPCSLKAGLEANRINSTRSL